MEHIYAPWRYTYFHKKPDECVFCKMAKDNEDEQNMILFRDSKCYGVMNLYPYSPGHFMIIPYAHEQALQDLDDETWMQISLHVKSGSKLLREVLGADGVNIGMNLGKRAGAGIAEHLHYHLVPRRENDSNFMTTIAKTRVNGLDFKSVYEQIKNSVPKYFKLSL